MDPLFRTLLARMRATPGEPFVTWYGTGARVELSAASFTNAVAKTAGLLREEFDPTEGRSVRLDLGLHWQLSVWLAACDAVGLDVQVGAAGPAATDIVATMDPSCRWPGAAVLVSDSPLGLPAATAGPGVVDHAREAAGQPDVYRGRIASGRLWHDDRWLTAQMQGEAAVPLAAAAGLQPGGRLEVAPHPQPGLSCYALPLLYRASVVLLADGGADTAAERITARLPVDPTR